MDVRLHVFQPEDFDLRLGIGRSNMGLVSRLVSILTSQALFLGICSGSIYQYY